MNETNSNNSAYSKSILDLKHERDINKITREEYWAKMRERLAPVTDLISIAAREKLIFEINSDGAIVSIPLSNHGKSVRMILDINDIRTVPFTVMAEGPYEELQAEIMFALGQNSSHFLDIGANMGFYSLSLGVLNPKMIIEAFEPQPKTFSVLQKNILINNLEAQVIANNCGIGSKSDSIEMYIPKFTGSGGGSFADLHQEEGDAEKIQVSVLALDSRISEGHKIDFMKVDVEGFEFEVITGALGTIQRDKPTIVIELLRKWMAPFGKHPQDVINQLEPFGYSTFAIGSESLIQTSIIDEDTTETNFIFVHKDNLIHTETLQKYI